jgi:large subunit ribosomal protein L1
MSLLGGILSRSLLGALRFRRYRPFARPVKAKVHSPPTTSPAAPGVSSAALPKPSAMPVEVSAFQGVKLARAFQALDATPEKLELEVRLDVDVRKVSVRGVVQLPHGIRSSEKLLVFCQDAEADDTIQAGADFAGLGELVSRIQKGWLGFDRCIATASVMPKILPIARILGPKKLMPNPKSGTIVTDLNAAIKEIKAGGLVEFRADDDGRVNIVIASSDFVDSEILENMKFFVKEIFKHKPKNVATAKKGLATSQGSFILEAALKTESGPKVTLDVEKIHPNGAGYFR